MNAYKRTLREILYSSDRYVIPVFQRFYMWKKDEWEKLWDDLYALLTDRQSSNEKHKRHFLGSIVCLEQPRVPGDSSAYQVIDGQQRLVTLSIFLCAIRDIAQEKEQQQLADQIQEFYLVHKFNSGDQRYKIFPRLTDRDDYLSLIEKQHDEREIEYKRKTKTSGLITLAYNYFINSIKETFFSTTSVSILFDLRDLFTALTDQTDFVLITLKEENPFSIFKSLNSTGVELEQGDLIRNHVFMAVSIDKQDLFDEKHWRQLEKMFENGKKLDAKQFTEFFKCVLMSKGDYVQEQSVYEQFANNYPLKDIMPESIVSEFSNKASQYNTILGKEIYKSDYIEPALQKIRGLKTTSAYPLIMKLVSACYDQQILKEQQLIKSLDLISGFVLRRFVCKESSRPYGRWFCSACKNLKKDYVLDLEDFFKDKGWPDDKLFIENFKKFDLYKSDYNSYILRNLENYIQSPNERVNLDKCSIEHVMPQTIDKDDEYGQAWIKDLGEDWEAIHKGLVHTIGNLTLVGQDYNSSMLNKPFHEKKIVLNNSKVYLNKHFNMEIKWDKEAIEKRAQKLAEIASSIWLGPGEQKQN